ncbi:MAG: type I restriction endonuclease subunit R [Actinobacteria bacterium]|nr:type I restriction endonuclease subunit R [Actinomycetota bacterium]
MSAFASNERYLSQIPALQLLVNLGYECVPPGRALQLRGGRLDNVILDEVLREQLKRINRIAHKGHKYLFSEENVQSAVQRLKSVRFDGLQRTNENVYDLLTLGTTLDQTIEGDSRGFDLRYIDWERPENNAYHVTAELAVERTKSDETARPDIVLFVNGIPLAVIECKAPAEGTEPAIKQHLRNQGIGYIPHLFTFAQLLLAVSKNEAEYGTVGTTRPFWATWRELRDDPATVAENVNRPLDPETKKALWSGELADARQHFDELEVAGGREVTPQDVTLHSLCRPDRLLDLAYRFTLFENGEKRIARYQQYFVVKSTLERVKAIDEHGAHAGGMIWHTQGSGKSLTMVWLARSLALDAAIRDPRIVLVCDRDDLDKQLKNTFAACGLSPKRATSGRNLLKLVADDQETIVTTIINKFASALEARSYVNDSPDIFMLVDESHRTQFGDLAARMRQMFPRACYLGFTGTPLTKRERNNFLRFGGLIDPSYSMRQAVDDKQVVPLLYEGRHVVMQQDQAAIDLWFERYTRGLTDEQQADLKRKYARAEMLSKADRVIWMRAFDISEHFRTTWQGTGFKAQLVAPDRPTAIRYKQFLDEIGDIGSEVLISAPDTREGWSDVDEEPSNEVVKFWQRMMARYGDEAEYNKQLISRFRNDPQAPEIIIVVDKLLTGFDAPRNTVLYLCRGLREHTLLQAVARVNRLFVGKEFGYIVDYEGTLGELDQALTMYDPLQAFDETDVIETVRSVQAEVTSLRQRHSDLLSIFKTVEHTHDEEAYERLLADEAVRHGFYDRLSAFARTLALALSTDAFIRDTPPEKVRAYRDDLRRFENLRRSVRRRYAETVDCGDHEPKIKKLLDTHIGADEVIQLNEPVNIFDEAEFADLKAERGVSDSAAARADAIAHATRRVISERMDEDPALYASFSEMIQQAIDDFLARRISEREYLEAIIDVRDRVVAGRHDGAPLPLQDDDAALAYFGVIRPVLQDAGLDSDYGEQVAVDAALAVPDILKRHDKVHFWDDTDAQNRVLNDLDDYFFDVVRDGAGAQLTVDDIDDVIARIMRVARSRSGR